MKVLLVYSSKGGIGKSTVACNLAFTLQAMGARVGLFDADFKTPSIARLLSGVTLAELPVMSGLRIKPARAENGMLVQTTAYFNQNEMLFWTDDYIDGALWQLFSPTDWSGVDYLIADMPPAIETIHARLCSLFADAKVLLASTYSPLSIEDCKKGMAFLNELEMETIGIVMNMVYMHCEHCGQVMHLFDHGNMELPLPILQELPLSQAVVESAQLGIPLAMRRPISSEARAFQKLANTVTALL